MDEFRYLSAASITSESARIEENIIPKILQIFEDSGLSYREARWISDVLVQEVESKCNGVLSRAKFEKDEGADSHEQGLIEAMGADKFKSIGKLLADVVRWHDLQKSPEVCRKLFAYMSDVIDGWNEQKS